jgi:hypothetical protein
MLALLTSLTVAVAQPGGPQPCRYPAQFTTMAHTFIYGQNIMEVGAERTVSDKNVACLVRSTFSGSVPSWSLSVLRVPCANGQGVDPIQKHSHACTHAFESEEAM